MVAVRINGGESNINGNGVSRVTDLIELIKTSIDPEHMIVSILVDGRELEESDWTSQVNQYSTSIIEIETGTPDSYVAGRMHQSGDIVQKLFLEFRDARKWFQDGKMVEGNRSLVHAVNGLRAFFEWYGAVTQVAPEGQRTKYDISSNVKDLSETCKLICQQQLYQSWWALGETLEKQLEPKLDKLESSCRKFRYS